MHRCELSFLLTCKHEKDVLRAQTSFETGIDDKKCCNDDMYYTMRTTLKLLDQTFDVHSRQLQVHLTCSTLRPHCSDQACRSPEGLQLQVPLAVANPNSTYGCGDLLKF